MDLRLISEQEVDTLLCLDRSFAMLRPVNLNNAYSSTKDKSEVGFYPSIAPITAQKDGEWRKRYL